MSQLWILQIEAIGLLDPIAILFFVAAAVAFWAVWVVLRRPLDLEKSEGDRSEADKKEEEAPAASPRQGGPRR